MPEEIAIHLNRAARDVVAERQRQVSAEGYSLYRDVLYMNGELAEAGATYASLAGNLVHRRPDRLKQKQAQTKDHWTQVEERYLTRAFKEAREAAGCYKGWKEEEMSGFHEVRALSLHLYQKAGKDGQKIAGHASEKMTKNYQKDHTEIVWSEAIPDLNISGITG